MEGVQGDTDEWKPYELERLVNKRIVRYDGKAIIEYLAKYKGYSSAHNEWFPVDCLGNAKELVQEYEDKLCSLPAPRQRGQSKNKLAEQATQVPAPRQRGRPKGSRGAGNAVSHNPARRDVSR